MLSLSSRGTVLLAGRTTIEARVLGGHAIKAGPARCVRDDGTLAGTALDMASAVRNSVNLLQMPLTDALRAASAEPARFLGLAHRLGRIARGYRADMVALDPNDVRILQTWVAGRGDGGSPAGGRGLSGPAAEIARG